MRYTFVRIRAHTWRAILYHLTTTLVLMLFPRSHVLAQFLDDSKTLGAYGPKDHDVLHVVDNDPNSFAANGGLDNVNLVKKYVHCP